MKICKQACFAGCTQTLPNVTPPKGKIYLFSKIATPFEPIIEIRCPLKFRMPKAFATQSNLLLEAPYLS